MLPRTKHSRLDGDWLLRCVWRAMLQHRTGPGPPETSTCGHGLVLEVGQLDHSTDGRGAGAQDFKMPVLAS